MKVHTAPWLLCLCACAGLLLAGPGEAAARSKRHQSSHGSSTGRAHLRKANALAGHGKCAQAVREYTRAYDKLHDPVLLFNRAECYRRMKEDQKAAADYRAFLEEMPRAPNRADIEARIAQLEGGDAAAPPEPKPKPSAKPEPSAETSSPPPLDADSAFPPLPPAKTASASPPAPLPPATEADRPKPRATATAVPPPVPPQSPSVIIDDDASTAPVLVETHPRPPAEEKKASGGSHWFLVVALGLIVAGAGAAGYVLLRPKGQVIPATDLGDYRF
jgi:hypothetical protein